MRDVALASPSKNWEATEAKPMCQVGQQARHCPEQGSASLQPPAHQAHAALQPYE